MIVGNLVAGKRIAQACGRDVAQLEDNDQARKVERFLHFPALRAAVLWSNLSLDRLPSQPVSEVAASFFQLGCK